MESIREILSRELKKRSFITNQNLDPEELFEKQKAAEWIKKLLVSDEVPDLDRRIDTASSERLAHAAAAFLIGIAAREEMGLNFDFLPRMFSYNASGDAFYFFWSVICLCHDFGYQYENDPNNTLKQSMMDTHEGRCKLLKIENDLFELSGADLKSYGLKEKEMQWVEASLRLAINYDKMRRRTKDENKEGAVIDHGVAGALILYDLLIKQHRCRTQKAAVVKSETGYRSPASGTAVLSGEISVNAASERFAACCILIACIVARHNIWNASKSEINRYQMYGLGMLGAGMQEALVSADDQCGQMLFLLDYMDTIDPVKVFYTRKVEKMKEHEKEAKSADLDHWRTFLLDKILIAFPSGCQNRYRWEAALNYIQFIISLQKNLEYSAEELSEYTAYANSVAQMSDWLKTRRPVISKMPDGQADSVTCFYPFYFKKEREWTAGIKDNEIAALCLYEGCGGSTKASAFYQNPNMYQTLNLIMMEGLEGEKARICQEGQRPDGCYIREWEKTLEVMTDIFTAQGKYMNYCRKNNSGDTCKEGQVNTVYRVDRRANYEMMCGLNRTFAFMSTSKAEYLKGIADLKKELVLLELTYDSTGFYIDYENVLKEDYVYLNEQEILFPPFLKLENVQECELTEDEKQRFEIGREDKVRKYQIRLGRFIYQDEIPDEIELITKLDKNKNIAADILDNMRIQGTIEMDAESQDIYTSWKRDFQQLAWQCFSNIGRAYERSHFI